MTPVMPPFCSLCQVRHWIRQGHISEVKADQPHISRERVISTAEGPPPAQLTKVDGCRCLKKKCGHTWVPRDMENLPQYCPKCKSATWFKVTI